MAANQPLQTVSLILYLSISVYVSVSVCLSVCLSPSVWVCNTELCSIIS